MTAPDYATLNAQPLNRQAAAILSHHRIPWIPGQEVAALALVRAFFANIDGSFEALGISAHLTLGGSHADGSAAYGDMTRLCLEASTGFRKPDISLLVRDDMPPDSTACHTAIA